MSARYRFLPWVRQGAAAAIRTVDTLGAGVAERPTLPIALRVNDRADLSVSLRMYGPGDVIGIDTRVIVRSDPPHLAGDFEPNYFPAIEFDRADFPWLLTPATGDSQGRLRPWLCLVVVRKQAGVALRPGGRRALAVLSITAPARPADELPDLAESWAWAHTQVVSADDAQLEDLLDAAAGRAVSRLICPRRLEPGRSYLACLVPAFAAGRRAGLDLSPALEDGELAPAWRLGDDAPNALDLPVYYHWEFSTGPAGDFESLARRLQGRPLPDGLGSRSLRVGDAGAGLPDGGSLPMEGALRAPRDTEQPAVPAPFRAALQQLLNLPERLRSDAADDPIVAPPIYAGRHAAQRLIDPAAPRWLAELNLDPRYRAAAGLGTLVVIDQQELLMASAWEQLGPVGSEPRRLHQPALARAVLGTLHAHLAQLAPARFLRVTAPMHARVRLERPGVIFAGQPAPQAAQTVRQHLRTSRMATTLASSTFRRVARPRGPLRRRAPTERGVAPGRVAAPRPRGAARARTATHITPDAIEQRLRSLTVLSTQLQIASEFNAAVRELNGYFASATGDGASAAPPRPQLLLEPLQQALLLAIDPARTVTGRDRLRGRAATPADTTQPALPGPSFPQPMYTALRDLAPDALLPGIERILPDSVLLLETNPAFIEAFMAGLNHEMARELLWREHPSNLRATFFRSFWDSGGASAPEMPELHRWAHGSALGDHMAAGSGGEHLVLLLRGELLRRYPAAVIYAQRAASLHTTTGPKKYPIFRAAPAPDITCLGFELTATVARSRRGDAGWFFVIEQPPTQARFGLDQAVVTGRDPAQIASWNALTWGDTAASDADLTALTHAPVAGRLLGRRIATLEWGLNAGHMAAITLQRPVRVLLHADTLLPPV